MLAGLMKECARKLEEHSDTPLLDCRVLMKKALDKGDTFIFTNPHYELSTYESSYFNEMLRQRISGEPVAYITGEKEFYGRDFHVKKGVLIPRPDTEILIEEILRTKKSGRILDIGTGSGIIAITLAIELIGSKVYAVDISDVAIETAGKNAKALKADVDIIRSNLFENVDGRFDIIVSNPPYIATEVMKGLEVFKTEPETALDGGSDGLDFYRKIITEAFEHLNHGGLLAFEIGYDQGKAVSELMKVNNYSDVIIRKDLGGNDRVVMGYRGE